MHRSNEYRGRMLAICGASAALMSGCMQRVPIATSAMPGSDVQIVSPAGMLLLDAPGAGSTTDVGCRVTEVEGRVNRLVGDTAYLRPVTWWRAEAGKRKACEKVGNAAVVILPDSATREIRAIRTDRKRTGWLVGSIVGTIVLIVGAFVLLISALLGGFS